MFGNYKVDCLKNFKKLILILVILLLYSCKEKSETDPNNIPDPDNVANSDFYLSFRADGKEYKFNESEINPINFFGGVNTGEGFNGNGYKGSIVAEKISGLPRISILIYSSKIIKDTIYISNGNTTMVVLDCFMPTGDGSKYKLFGSSANNKAQIVTVTADGVTGTFSGTLFSSSEKLLITDGKFYLPRIN